MTRPISIQSEAGGPGSPEGVPVPGDEGVCRSAGDCSWCSGDRSAETMVAPCSSSRFSAGGASPDATEPRKPRTNASGSTMNPRAVSQTFWVTKPAARSRPPTMTPATLTTSARRIFTIASRCGATLAAAGREVLQAPRGSFPAPQLPATMPSVETAIAPRRPNGPPPGDDAKMTRPIKGPVTRGCGAG